MAMRNTLALYPGSSPYTNACLLRSRTTLRSSFYPGASLALPGISTCLWDTSGSGFIRPFNTYSQRLVTNDQASHKKRTSRNPSPGPNTKRNTSFAKVTKHTIKHSSNRAAPRGQRGSTKEDSLLLANAINSLNLPTFQEIPTLPKNIFKDPVSGWQIAKSYLAKVQEKSIPSDGKYKHVIDVEDPVIGTLHAEGEASTKMVAEKIANLHLLSKLHETGSAAVLFPLKGEKVEKERDAILDVYLYAARYEEVPQVTIKAVSRGGARKASFFEAQVTLPLLAITASARSRTRQSAIIAAALNTKQAMERFFQDNDLTHKLVKDDEAFTLQSATDFCHWYKIENRGVALSLKTQESQGEFSSVLIAEQSETAVGENREFGPARSLTKKGAEDLAHLMAAVTISREEPYLRSQFFQKYRENNNQILNPLRPIDLVIAEKTRASIKRAINASINAAEQLEEDENIEDLSERRHGTIYSPLPQTLHQRKCDDLQRRLQTYSNREDLVDLRKTRSEYPMNQYGEKVLETIKSNTYSIVIGATGSGKTTQVPQILLNDAIVRGEGANCNIICTQPRRIAAKSVAQRVADERAEYIGDCVGYHVKKDTNLPNYGGSINYCTTGILSQQLQFAADEIMDNVSHIIIDEVHERDIIIDFTLTTLKRLVKTRLAEGKKVPHITLMSATIDADLFADYLSIENAQGEIIECPTLTVPGRTFPVKEFYLDQVLQKIQSSPTKTSIQRDEDTIKYLDFEQKFSRNNQAISDSAEKTGFKEDTAIDWVAERQKGKMRSNITIEEQEQAMVPHRLAASTIMHIASSTDSGAILTFLPGLEDITKINDILRDSRNDGLDFTDESKFKIFMLHSSIANTQKDVFEQLPAGCRKIILATNIAETSITIPDVQHVIDTGKHRELQYDQTRRITKLACVWVSKSNAKQRAGRAGRVQDGNFYALYSKERYESLRAVGLPELLRSDLQEVCLDVKNQGFTVPVKEFLSETIEPPSAESVDRALRNLYELQALNQDETLTPLGKLLAQLPVHPSLGKMIVLGIVFRCLDPMLIIGSSFSERNLFAQPLEARKEATETMARFCKSTSSDHIGLLTAIKELRMVEKVRGPRALYDYAMRNYLHINAYRGILSTAEAIEELLAEHGVIPRTHRHDRTQFQFGSSQLNENSDKVGLIKSLILAGFSPNLGLRKGRVAYRTPRDPASIVWPRSINAIKLGRSKTKQQPLPDPKTELLSFSELVRSSDGMTLYIRETTPVTPLMSMLFSNKLESKTRNKILVDEWLPYYLQDPSDVSLLLILRRALQKVSSAAFRDLAARRVLTDHEQRNRFADHLVEVLDADLESYTVTTRNGQSLPTARGRPSAVFGASVNNQQDARPKMLSAWDSLVSGNGLPSRMSSSSNRENPIPASVMDLFSQKNNSAKVYKEKGY